MELNRGHIIFGAVCLVAGIVLGAGFRSCSSKPAEPALRPEVIHDTVCIHDTMRIAAKTTTRYITRTDTVVKTITVLGDTVTVPVEMPLEHKQYRDTFTTDSSRIELGVRFSGWHAQIDGIDLKSQYTIQPRTIEKKKGWGQFIGVGIGVGYGASFVGNGSGVTIVHAAPEIGVHITYGWGYHW